MLRYWGNPNSNFLKHSARETMRHKQGLYDLIRLFSFGTCQDYFVVVELQGWNDDFKYSMQILHKELQVLHEF